MFVKTKKNKKAKNNITNTDVTTNNNTNNTKKSIKKKGKDLLHIWWNRVKNPKKWETVGSSATNLKTEEGTEVKNCFAFLINNAVGFSMSSYFFAKYLLYFILCLIITIIVVAFIADPISMLEFLIKGIIKLWNSVDISNITLPW